MEAMDARMVKERGGVYCELEAVGISQSRYGEEVQPDAVPLTEKSLANWRKVISVNLDGVFLTDRACAREMVKSGKGGRIINIASGAARLPTPGVGEYSVSKAGVWMLTKVLATELAQYGITA